MDSTDHAVHSVRIFPSQDPSSAGNVDKENIKMTEAIPGFWSGTKVLRKKTIKQS